MQAEPQDEHRWLSRLVGDWTCEAEMAMGPDQPVTKSRATERVRSIGDIWIIGEGEGEMPGGGTAYTVLTLGYDTMQKRFVGSWIGSMMTNMWVYNGWLDNDRRILTLEAQGPDMSVPGKTATYRDIVEMKSDDHRILTSQMLGDDGQWHQFMTAHYRRRK
jgi:hypothetical protein